MMVMGMTEKRLIRTIGELFENISGLDYNKPVIICHKGIEYDVNFFIENKDKFIIVTGKEVDDGDVE